ncbi:MAG: tetratricopeptide repeat protein, partial [Gloeomargarita sp. SKYG98]|nr:tetratricopeptide repeat protein [Gloeomargarita sp. SKYG98]
MAPSPAQIDRLLHQAVECHLAGQWEKAEALYRQILQQQPEHPDASHNLGQLWRQRGQPKAAIPLLQVAWRVNPYATQYWLSLVTALAECGEWSLLVQVLAQACATQLTQETVTALAELVSQIGDALSCNQRWTEALVVLEKGVALAPNHPAIWKSYGIALHGAGQVQAAQAAYEKALALNPHCLDAVNNLGVLAMGRRDWQAALHYFERALGIAPDHPDVWFNKAMTLKKLQRFQEAETWARRVLDARSQDPRVLRLLGEILTELRQYSEAREWLEKALGQEPDNWETLQALANHYARQERWEEAEKWARKLQDKMPDNPDVLRPLGQILLKLGREP